VAYYGSISCLYNEITWGTMRASVIENLKDANSPMISDMLIDLLDNYKWVVIIVEYILAPVFFMVIMWDVVTLLVGKNKAYKK